MMGTGGRLVYKWTMLIISGHQVVLLSCLAGLRVSDPQKLVRDGPFDLIVGRRGLKLDYDPTYRSAEAPARSGSIRSGEAAGKGSTR